MCVLCDPPIQEHTLPLVALVYVRLIVYVYIYSYVNIIYHSHVFSSASTSYVLYM